MARKRLRNLREGGTYFLLQWSRANNGAETRRTPSPGSARESFNGAAPTMARKRKRTGGPKDDHNQLQWSRANNGAETQQCSLQACLCRLASMEPRQQWRGNWDAGKMPSARRGCFNGAAPTMARKQDLCGLRLARRDASMEPRQQWRGNRSIVYGQFTTQFRFNGAAPTMARKPKLNEDGTFKR